MWRRYYCHYSHLVRSLRQHGYETHDTFKVIIGDPATIVLLDPVVCVAFIVDSLASIDYASRAMLRATQIESLVTFGLATLYLSRVLWFAYAGLTMASFVLKRLRTIPFVPLDTTTLALSISILAGPLTYLQSRTLVCIDVYNWAVACVLPCPSYANETIMACIVYSATVALAPFANGLLVPVIHRFYHRKVSVATRIPRFASYAPAMEIKHQLLLAIAVSHPCMWWHREEAMTVVGGAFHRITSHEPAYRKNMGLAQRSADAHVLCGRPGVPRVRLNMTLVQLIDMPLETPPKPRTLGSIKTSNGAFVIHCGANQSPWVL
ncbi:hypothetical protein ACHHYP_11493 [Achlya hypogyna]|uniref:Transmembrane protein n=1 Tax=Achlya hypogyna TaxID=1202772 RepID=A0A1V9YJ26_ACHHY|nr:hypothetical protein ACHHYP_11493 [Achlya hypogyna]